MIGELRSNAVRSRAFKIFYLTAITVAMIGWSWMLIESLAWAINI
jgi:hypothetical protein